MGLWLLVYHGTTLTESICPQSWDWGFWGWDTWDSFASSASLSDRAKWVGGRIGAPGGSLTRICPSASKDTSHPSSLGNSCHQPSSIPIKLGSNLRLAQHFTATSVGSQTSAFFLESAEYNSLSPLKWQQTIHMACCTHSVPKPTKLLLGKAWEISISMN